MTISPDSPLDPTDEVPEGPQVVGPDGDDVAEPGIDPETTADNPDVAPDDPEGPSS